MTSDKDMNCDPRLHDFYTMKKSKNSNKYYNVTYLFDFLICTIKGTN